MKMEEIKRKIMEMREACLAPTQEWGGNNIVLLRYLPEKLGASYATIRKALDELESADEIVLQGNGSKMTCFRFIKDEQKEERIAERKARQQTEINVQNTLDAMVAKGIVSLAESKELVTHTRYGGEIVLSVEMINRMLNK
jgi:DNA-binding transcriptional regulator YhcF (GntR family)